MTKKTVAELSLFRRANFRAAVATRHVTDRAQSDGLMELNELELSSIYALFAWVANQQASAEETVQCVTETRFGVNRVTDLKQKDYEEVIQFLIDLRLDEMKN